MDRQIWEHLTLTGQSSTSLFLSLLYLLCPGLVPHCQTSSFTPTCSLGWNAKAPPLVVISLDISLRSSYPIPSDKTNCSLFRAPKAQSSQNTYNFMLISAFWGCVFLKDRRYSIYFSSYGYHIYYTVLPLLSIGIIFQDPQWVPETRGSTKPVNHLVVYTNQKLREVVQNQGQKEQLVCRWYLEQW